MITPTTVRLSTRKISKPSIVDYLKVFGKQNMLNLLKNKMN